MLMEYVGKAARKLALPIAFSFAAGCAQEQPVTQHTMPTAQDESYTETSYKNTVVEVGVLVMPRDTMWGFSREIYGAGSVWEKLLHEEGYDTVAEPMGSVGVYIGKFPKGSMDDIARKSDKRVLRALDNDSNPRTDLRAGDIVILPLTVEDAERFIENHPDRIASELRDVMSISNIAF